MKKYTLLLLIIPMLIVSSFFIVEIKSVYAAIIIWIQNDWTGGSGQATWSDPTKFDSFTGNYELSNIGGQTGVGPSINADVVVGQPNMTSNDEYQGGAGAANNLSFSPDVAPLNGKLYVVDANRVLVYNSIPTADNTSADFVIGRPNLTDVGYYGAAANTVGAPNSVTSDGTKLLIADTSYSRVLVYNTEPTADDASADVVIGQADMTSGTANQGGSAAANTLYFPHSVHYDTTANKLFIADEYNHRILGYNSIPTVDNASADFVIGQSDFTSSTPKFPVSASSLSYPYDVYSDGTKLFVADSGHNRILIWNTIPTSSNVPASVVVGQANMTGVLENENGDVSTPTRTGLYFPTCVFSDGTKLYICDTNNNRVLVYNSIPTSNHAAADYVIGQIPGIGSSNRGGSVNSNTLRGVYNLYVKDDQLFIADQNNYRILIFNLNDIQNSVLTSSVYDAGTSETWGPLRYDSITPPGASVSFEVSTDGGTVWDPVTDYTSQTFGPSTTVAYRATFSSTDGISMPLLQNVRIRNGDLPPTVTTSPASSVAEGTQKNLSGEITDIGGPDVTEIGFQYGKNDSYGSTVSESAGSYSVGTFSLLVSGLSCGTYHFRAFATNAVGNGYGADQSFTSFSCGSGSGRDGGGGSSMPPSTTDLPTTSPAAGCDLGEQYSTSTGLPCPNYVPTVLPTPPCPIVKTLRIGMKGCDVLELHKKMSALGYYHYIIDDSFGRILKASVIKFQLVNKLVGDGVVGPRTRTVLNIYK